MTDTVLISSPLGPLAFTPSEISEASARAKEMVLALGLAPQATSTPSKEGQETSWLSVDEVAQRSGLKKSWIYEQVRSDNIPHRHFGKQVRIPASYRAEPVPKSGAHQPGGQ